MTDRKRFFRNTVSDQQFSTSGKFGKYIDAVFHNPLDDYMMYNYNLKLSMIQIGDLANPIYQSEPAGDVFESGNIIYQYKQLLEAPAVPFAYFGATPEQDASEDLTFIIDDLNFKHFFSPNSKFPSGSGFLQGNIVLKEPLGYNFQSSLQSLAEKAGYFIPENANEDGEISIATMRIVYRIDISFAGYKEDGTYDSKIEFNYPFLSDDVPDETEFTLFVHIIKATTDFEGTGSTTTLDFVELNNIGMMPEYSVLNRFGDLGTYIKQNLQDEGVELFDIVRVEGSTDQEYYGSIARTQPFGLKWEQWVSALQGFLQDSVAIVEYFTDDIDGNALTDQPDAFDYKYVYNITYPEELKDDLVYEGFAPLEFLSTGSFTSKSSVTEVLAEGLKSLQSVQQGMQQYPRVLYIIRTRVDYSDAKPIEATQDYYNIKIDYIIDRYYDFRYVPSNRAELFNNTEDKLKALVSSRAIRRAYYYDNFGINTEVINYRQTLNMNYYKNLSQTNSTSAKISSTDEIRRDLRRRYNEFDPSRDIKTRNSGLREDETINMITMLFGKRRITENFAAALRSSTSMPRNASVSLTSVRPHLNAPTQSINDLIDRAGLHGVVIRTQIFSDNPVTELDVEEALTKLMNVPSVQEDATRIYIQYLNARTEAYRKEYNDLIEVDLLKLENFEVRGDPRWLFNLKLSAYFETEELLPRSEEEYGAAVIVVNSIVPEPNEFMKTDNRNEPIKPQHDFSGFYQVIHVEHKFQGGKYTQGFDAIRLMGLTEQALASGQS